MTEHPLHFVTNPEGAELPCVCARGIDHPHTLTGYPVGQEPDPNAPPEEQKRGILHGLFGRKDPDPGPLCVLPGCGHPLADHSDFGCMADGCDRPGVGGACREYADTLPEPLAQPVTHEPEIIMTPDGPRLDVPPAPMSVPEVWAPPAEHDPAHADTP